MILKEYQLELKIFKSKNLLDTIGPDYNIHQFHLPNYDRDYDVFLLESNNQRLIVKKTYDCDEIDVYKLFESVPNEFVPKLHFVEEMDKSYWIGLSYIENIKEDYTKENVEEVVKALAEFHNLYMDVNINTLGSWKKRSDLDKLHGQELTDDEIRLIKDSQEILNQSSKTLIHNDMIPLNIIMSDQGVKFVDWELGKCGPYILDLGRLLSDYNKEKPWINQNYLDDALAAYFQTIELDISFSQFRKEFQCARINNYLGIVRAFVIREWDKTDWYYQNVRELKRALEVFVDL